MKKIHYILLGLVLLASSNSYAQHDTDFWFAVPRYLSEHNNENWEGLYFVFACPEGEANVTISFPAMPTIAPLHYKVTETPVKVYLGSDFHCINYNIAPLFNKVSQRGIHIESDIPIQCYYQIPGANAATYSLKGQQGLGKDFILTMQRMSHNCYHETKYEDAVSSFEIVATEDNTLIRIYPSNPYYLYHSHNTAPQSDIVPQTMKLLSDLCYSSAVSISLNKGETYAMRACGHNENEQLAGTRIEANKPISVIGNDDSVDHLGGCDSYGDQLYPNSMAGTEFIIADCRDGEVPNEDRWENDDANNNQWHGVNVYPLYEGTKITITNIYKNGSSSQQTVILNKFSNWNSTDLIMKQTVHFISSNNLAAMHISSSKPILVSQESGYNYESGIAMIPPLNIMGMNEFSYNSLGTLVLHLITKNEYADGFKVNGEPLASPLHPIAGTDYSFIATRVSIYGGVLHVGNTEGPFQAGVRDYADPGCSFTYFADLPSKGQVVITDTENPYDETNNTPGTLGDNGKEELFYPNVIRMGSTYYTCLGNDVQFEAKMSDGTAISSPQWTLPSGQVRFSNTLSIHGVTTADVGEYSLRGTVEGETVEASFSLIVPDSAESNVITRVAMCEGATYTWPINNRQYTAPARDTIYVSTLIDGQQLSGSCTTNLILDLQANNDLDTTYFYYSLAPGDTLNWLGEKIMTPGIFQHVVETQMGCSTLVYLTVSLQYFIDEEIIPGYDTGSENFESLHIESHVYKCDNNAGDREGYVHITLYVDDPTFMIASNELLIGTSNGYSTTVEIIDGVAELYIPSAYASVSWMTICHSPWSESPLWCTDFVYDNPDHICVDIMNNPYQDPEDTEPPTQPEDPENPSQPEDPENPGQSEEIDPENLEIFIYQDNTDAVLVVNTGKHEANINIYSSLGTRVYSTHKELNTNCFIMPLPIGTYIAVIELDNKLTVKKKFVIRE